MKRKAVMLCVGVILVISTIISANATLLPEGQIDEQETIAIPTLEEIKNMDLTKPCGLTAEQLKKGLLYDLKRHSETYIKQEENGVNAVFMSAKDAFESGWGRYQFEENNISGFNKDGKFESEEECIWHVSDTLKRLYLTKHEECGCYDPYCQIGLWYHGVTVYSISTHYCPVDGVNPNYEYSNEVCDIMLQIYKRALS